MGREIRRVPPNWQHPVAKPDCFGRGAGLQPMYDKTYAQARQEWLENLARWEAGEDPDREQYKHDDGSYQDWWEWNGGPPDRAYYRPWKDEDATWWQVWETVSEGTPVSPPHETAEGLIRYLALYGDQWDQTRAQESGRANSGWGYERAKAFVESGWVPSFVMHYTPGQPPRMSENAGDAILMSWEEK